MARSAPRRFVRSFVATDARLSFRARRFSGFVRLIFCSFVRLFVCSFVCSFVRSFSAVESRTKAATTTRTELVADRRAGVRGAAPKLPRGGGGRDSTFFILFYRYMYIYICILYTKICRYTGIFLFCLSFPFFLETGGPTHDAAFSLGRRENGRRKRGQTPTARRVAPHLRNAHPGFEQRLPASSSAAAAARQ